jgi:hypothetical protein
MLTSIHPRGIPTDALSPLLQGYTQPLVYLILLLTTHKSGESESLSGLGASRVSSVGDHALRHL